MSEKRKCEVCGNEFVIRPRGPYRKYCSRGCKDKALFRRTRHPCPVCGTLISPNAKHCQKHKVCDRKMEKHPNWKGGKYKTNYGYIMLKIPNHPRADSHGYVFEHIYVWETRNGKPLPKGWVIHHLNGIRDDNRQENLVALSDKKHRTILQAKAKRIQELEALQKNQLQLL